MSVVEYCPRCRGHTGTVGFIHDLTCPYSPISNVTWPTFQPTPERIVTLKDILDKLDEILGLLRDRGPE